MSSVYPASLRPSTTGHKDAVASSLVSRGFSRHYARELITRHWETEFIFRPASSVADTLEASSMLDECEQYH